MLKISCVWKDNSVFDIIDGATLSPYTNTMIFYITNSEDYLLAIHGMIEVKKFKSILIEEI